MELMAHIAAGISVGEVILERGRAVWRQFNSTGYLEDVSETQEKPGYVGFDLYWRNEYQEVAYIPIDVLDGDRPVAAWKAEIAEARAEARRIKAHSIIERHETSERQTYERLKAKYGEGGDGVQG